MVFIIKPTMVITMNPKYPKMVVHYLVNHQRNWHNHGNSILGEAELKYSNGTKQLL